MVFHVFIELPVLYPLNHGGNAIPIDCSHRICSRRPASDLRLLEVHRLRCNGPDCQRAEFVHGAAVVTAPVLALKTSSPGPVMVPITVPNPAPGASNLRVGIGQAVTVGQDITAYVGAFQVYNLTALGLAGIA